MTGARVGELVGKRVEDADEGRYDAVGTLCAQGSIRRIEDRNGLCVDLRRGPHRVPHERHGHGRYGTVPAHVADRDQKASVQQLDGIVPVASDERLRTAGFVDGIERQQFVRGQH